VAKRDPVVDQDLDRSPQYDPARDHEAFAQPGAHRTADRLADDLRQREQRDDEYEPDQQRDLTDPPPPLARPAQPLDRVLEVRAERRLDLAGRARLVEPEHDLVLVLAEQILAGVEQQVREIRIEVALAERRRIAVVEDLFDGLQLDIDARHAVLAAISAGVAH